jgi:hypothetical protein
MCMVSIHNSNGINLDIFSWKSASKETNGLHFRGIWLVQWRNVTFQPAYRVLWNSIAVDRKNVVPMHCWQVYYASSRESRSCTTAKPFKRQSGKFSVPSERMLCFWSANEYYKCQREVFVIFSYKSFGTVGIY